MVEVDTQSLRIRSTLMSRAGQSLRGSSSALAPEQGADDLIGWLDERLQPSKPL